MFITHLGRPIHTIDLYGNLIFREMVFAPSGTLIFRGGIIAKETARRHVLIEKRGLMSAASTSLE